MLLNLVMFIYFIYFNTRLPRFFQWKNERRWTICKSLLSSVINLTEIYLSEVYVSTGAYEKKLSNPDNGHSYLVCRYLLFIEVDCCDDNLSVIMFTRLHKMRTTGSNRIIGDNPGLNSVTILYFLVIAISLVLYKSEIRVY